MWNSVRNDKKPSAVAGGFFVLEMIGEDCFAVVKINRHDKKVIYNLKNSLTIGMNGAIIKLKVMYNLK